jgi:hypothetical protein
MQTHTLTTKDLETSSNPYIQFMAREGFYIPTNRVSTLAKDISRDSMTIYRNAVPVLTKQLLPDHKDDFDPETLDAEAEKTFASAKKEDEKLPYDRIRDTYSQFCREINTQALKQLVQKRCEQVAPGKYEAQSDVHKQTASFNVADNKLTITEEGLAYRFRKTGTEEKSSWTVLQDKAITVLELIKVDQAEYAKKAQALYEAKKAEIQRQLAEEKNASIKMIHQNRLRKLQPPDSKKFPEYRFKLVSITTSSEELKNVLTTGILPSLDAQLPPPLQAAQTLSTARPSQQELKTVLTTGIPPSAGAQLPSPSLQEAKAPATAQPLSPQQPAPYNNKVSWALSIAGGLLVIGGILTLVFCGIGAASIIGGGFLISAGSCARACAAMRFYDNREHAKRMNTVLPTAPASSPAASAAGSRTPPTPGTTPTPASSRVRVNPASVPGARHDFRLLAAPISAVPGSNSSAPTAANNSQNRLT